LEKAWAFLMGGGSMIVARMQYADSAPPKQPWEPPETYIAPEESVIIQPTYDFIRTHLSNALPRMKPVDVVEDPHDGNWCLADSGAEYLVFALHGGLLRLDLSAAPERSFEARWFDPRNGRLSPAGTGSASGGRSVSLTAPDGRCWVLWLRATNDS